MLLFMRDTGLGVAAAVRLPNGLLAFLITICVRHKKESRSGESGLQVVRCCFIQRPLAASEWVCKQR